METKILREKFTKRLAELKNELEPKDRARLAVQMDVHIKSVERYLEGTIANIEVAEQMIMEAEKIIASKAEAAA